MSLQSRKRSSSFCCSQVVPVVSPKKIRISEALEALKEKDESYPKPGTLVDMVRVKKVGPFILGPVLGNSPVKSIVHYLARQEKTDKFFTVKILSLKPPSEEKQDDRLGKMLLHTEYSLLTLLRGQQGVIQHHGLYKDIALEEVDTSRGTVYSGRAVQRVALVLDCLTPHDFSPSEHINLQHYVIRQKRLAEQEALLIFSHVVRVVAMLHKNNVVHRDLKLGNIVLNRRTKKVVLTNFCLGKHLLNEDDLVKDQRGSPAYISPDVLSGKPYLGKPSDMWALGVVLYTMLYGQFPFYNAAPQELFRKIKAADYVIPDDGRVSEPTTMLIRRLLLLDPRQRITADQVTEHYFGRHTNLLRMMHSMYPAPRELASDDQVVPQLASPPAAEQRRPPTPVAAAASSLETNVNQLQLMESKLFTVGAERPPTPTEPAPANPLMALSRHDVIEHIDRVLQRRAP
ncbi:Serine/threonine-protein kinase 40 [Amphibalanus amphitrite]|uniref:Serine/threonine-protein kinase 40 n=1 Tax=Amphibalanus amphitrite TaxID=1232801 RepID=A0A6A4W132_AMPAM|nr:serine/threonine-protein kinase 40-like [Amphibalanus amphitrite]KAF0298939.1 Serine/threonine-protein kinase 40 [Amphibalanus amphitrite]